MSSRCAMRWSSFPESDRALLGVKMSKSAWEAFSPPGCHGRALPFLSLGDTRQHRRKHRRHRYRVENDVVLVREFGRQDGPCLLVAGPAQIRQEGVCCDFNASETPKTCDRPWHPQQLIGLRSSALCPLARCTQSAAGAKGRGHRSLTTRASVATRCGPPAGRVRPAECTTA